MTKKIIQVPVDDHLLAELDKISKRQHKARAELIREACATYMKELETEEMDRVYQEGYRRIPEETDLAEAQEKMLGEILPKETW